MACVLALFALQSGLARADDLAFPVSDPDSPLLVAQTGTEPDADAIAAQPRIGKIIIENKNVFDPDDPKDNKSIFRLANFLHFKTREHVIRDQLLFDSGEVFNAQALDESERMLRKSAYIYDANVTPVAREDGVVDVKVETRDVWTLNPVLSFGRSGGKNTSSIGLTELNVLGTGVSVGIARRTGVDRDSTTFSFLDPNLGSSRVRLGGEYASSSDGSSKALLLERPFYALDARWAAGVEWLDEDRIDSLYDRGEIANEFNHSLQKMRTYVGFSTGLQNGWVRRWKFGAAYSNDEFSTVSGSTMSGLVPEDRRYAYPFVSYEVIEDKFQKTRNHDQIDRTEDFYLGTRLGAELGWAASAFGSDRSALLLGANAGHGWQPKKGTTWLFSGDLSGRLEGGSAKNMLLGAGTRYYNVQSKKRLLFASLTADTTWNLDLDHQLAVGGEIGLRGYPLRYQSGEHRMLFSIEQRYFTDWYPFRLFHVGGAVFFDAGRTWGDSPVGDSDLGLLKDIGFGLRLAGSRSGRGRIVHADVAFPLDGDSSISSAQFLVTTKTSF